MKHCVRKNIFSAMILACLCGQVSAQVGPNPTTVGSIDRYRYYSAEIWGHMPWENAGGTPVLWGYSTEEGAYWVDIRWDYQGEHYLMFIGPGDPSVFITVNPCTPPPAPNIPTVSPNICGDRTISFNGSPPSGVTWYWQGQNQNGQNMTNDDPEITANIVGTYDYYLRSYKTNCWGPSVKVTVTVSKPLKPWAVIREPSNYTCGLKELTATTDDGPPLYGDLWYWQGKDPNGEEVNHPISAPLYADESTTYYIRAQSTLGCWSEPQEYLASVFHPTTPSNPRLDPGNTCGPQTIRFNGTPQPGITWYWQPGLPTGGLTGTTGIGSQSSMTFDQTGTVTYHLRAYAGGCWSPPSQHVTATVDNPLTPWPVVRPPADYTCGLKQLTAAPEDGGPLNGELWYWQGEDAGGMEPDHPFDVPFYAEKTGSYYIRAVSPNGCWSPAMEYYTTVYNPQMPGIKISENACDWKTAEFDGEAPSGHAWYWQSSPGGVSKDHSQSSFFLTEPITYRLHLRSNIGDCWSPAKTVTVTVYEEPPTPKDQTLNVCTWEKIVLDAGGSNSQWYDQSGLPLATAPTLVVGPFENAGTYQYQVELLGGGPCISERADIQINVTDACEDKMNYIETISYDSRRGTLDHETSRSISYFDQNAKPLQTQTKSYSKSRIMATQSVDDRFGRAVIATLPAPTSNPNFHYEYRFVRNPASSGRYNIESFDTPSTLTAPSPVGNQTSGTVGWYYSSNNTWEDNVATTGYPYSRTEFYKDGTGETKRTASAGDQHRLGTEHEILTGTFAVHNELDDYFEKRAEVLTGIVQSPALNDVGTQSVVRDQNGNYALSISDKSGKTLMTARSVGEGETAAFVIPISIKSQVVNPQAPNFRQATYLYLLEDRQVSISADPEYNENVQYVVEDMVSESQYSIPGSNVWKAGFYRIVLQSGAIKIDYANRFMDVSYQFYDDAGRLVASISPNGFEQWKNGIAYGLIDKTTYVYNHQGWLLSMTEPDAGTTEYLYRKDGKIRFSRNAKQLAHNSFSYTNYDNLGRAVQSGEYIGTTYSFASLGTQLEYTSQIDFLAADPDHTRDWIVTYYDKAPADLPGVTFQQQFIRGAISSTKNRNMQTWYSYNEMGRVVSVIQKPAHLNMHFLTEYTFDFQGNAKVVKTSRHVTAPIAGFQNVFYHHYDYDADQRLSKAYTSTDGSTKKLRAEYEYYLHGPLKRIELGTNIQGVDFVYNINGWLTQINHPETSQDPGNDAPETTGFRKDAFGMVLDYYESSMNNLYAGGPIPSIHNLNLIHGLPEQHQQLASHQPLIRFNTIEDPSSSISNPNVFKEYSAENPRYKKILLQH